MQVCLGMLSQIFAQPFKTFLIAVHPGCVSDSPSVQNLGPNLPKILGDGLPTGFHDRDLKVPSSDGVQLPSQLDHKSVSSVLGSLHLCLPALNLPVELKVPEQQLQALPSN